MSLSLWIFPRTERTKSPSVGYFSRAAVIAEICSIVKSLTLLSGVTPDSPNTLTELLQPIPFIRVRAQSILAFSGNSTPEILAILALSLLMLRVHTNHIKHPSALDQLTVFAHFLY